MLGSTLWIQVNNVAANGEISSKVLSWLVKQNLPKVTVPEFDGNPLDWLNLVTKFHVVVHKQEYLNDTQQS